MMTRPVFSELKKLVESVEMTTAQTIAGHQRVNQCTLFQPVVRSFARDDHIVNVTLAQARL